MSISKETRAKIYAEDFTSLDNLRQDLEANEALSIVEIRRKAYLQGCIDTEEIPKGKIIGSFVSGARVHKVYIHLVTYGEISKKQAKEMGIRNIQDCIYKLRYYQGVKIKTIHPQKNTDQTKYILL